MKVGFFDSGYGGLTILEAFKRRCPEVDTEYIADSRHCPYGNRSNDEIFRLSDNCVKRLLKRGCSIIVVACNTATAAAIDRLRAKYPSIPFVGLEPAIKPAAIRSKSGVVAVLATRGTFNGRLYNETKARFAKNVTVIATVADEFVTEVEKLKGAAVGTLGAAKRARLERIVLRRIEPLLAAGADKIVLGCTHFAHLRPIIEKIAGPDVEVVDSSDAVAAQIERLLLRHDREIGLLARREGVLI